MSVLLLSVNIDGRSAAAAREKLRLSRNLSIAGMVFGAIAIAIVIAVNVQLRKESNNDY